MSEITPTRSAALELEEERHAMQEGYVFLDEKCLVLAGEIMRQLERYTALGAQLRAVRAKAARSLEAAVVRHGLQGLECYPRTDFDRAELAIRRSMLLGVPLQQAELVLTPAPTAVAVHPSPEAEACRAAFVEVLQRSAALAALSGNLHRLHAEYRRSVRRARALQNVLLPEIESAAHEIEARLEELEQEDALRVLMAESASGR